MMRFYYVMCLPQIHGGTGATISQNAVYKNLGHAYFVEDGSETLNTCVTFCYMLLHAHSETPNTRAAPAPLDAPRSESTFDCSAQHGRPTRAA